MEAELKKKTTPPSQGVGGGNIEVEDLTGEVPQVDDLLSEIDTVLKETEVRINSCGC